MQYKLNNSLGIINIYGEDAKVFLQGQLTNDIYQLSCENKLQISAHLSHKGRMLANFIVIYVKEDSFYLLTPLEIIPTLIKRLSMFKLRSKVSINELACLIAFSDELDSRYELNAKILDKYLLITDNSLDINNTTDNDAWLEFIINHGIAMIYPPTSELFIPQDVNLDLINGVSFKKGCYIGQEIVARLHYLGKPKRRMYRFEIADSSSIIKRGDKLIVPSMNNQEVGYIVEVLENNGSYIGLCSCYISYIEEVYHQPSSTRLMLSTFSFEE